MPVTVVHDPPDETDTALDRVTVITVDATGQRREYDISLTPDQTFDDGYLLSGRRVDGEYRDREVGKSPSATAWDAARDYFRAEGWEVHG